MTPNIDVTTTQLEMNALCKSTRMTERNYHALNVHLLQDLDIGYSHGLVKL